MENAARYCLVLFTDVCRTMGDWKDFTAIIVAVVGLPAAIVAGFRALREYKRSREQREEELAQREAELRLRRTEFTLAHHRRLYEDPVIWRVLSMLEGDRPELATVEMWEAKRKFVTFIEELWLLVRAKYIDEQVALYMFGYYAKTAYKSPNFGAGFEWDPQFWGLFMEFAERSEAFYAGREVALQELKL